ncbi:MAG: hypothetical protein LAP40_26230 [Acidobacteriia bacterium]|nr:hypothetical protein [Terriglobia bacterium]
MRTFGIFCFAAALALNVHAEVVYDNTAHGNTPGQSTPIDAGPLYDSFSTGALSEALTGLDLVLDSTTGGTDPFDVLLYSDDTNLLDYPSTGPPRPSPFPATRSSPPIRAIGSPWYPTRRRLQDGNSPTTPEVPARLASSGPSETRAAPP